MFRVDLDKCRFCGSNVEILKNLGELYSCGIFPKSVDDHVDRGFLRIGICNSCALVQLLEDYDHNSLYTKSYGYRSSLNESMVAHLNNIASEISSFLTALNSKNDLAHLDIGSNDATLLNQVNDKMRIEEIDINQLGVDPSGEGFKSFYKYSELLVEPFNLDIARRVGRKFQVISSIAMFYDLPDPKNFVDAISETLSDDGIWISEQSYFFRMVEQDAFDTICQEHIEYYSLHDVANLCNASGLELFDVKFNEINGGSFRFYAQHKGGQNERTTNLIEALDTESKRDKRKELLAMFDRIENLKATTVQFLSECKSKGLEVHGYGASTKGNTLLQYFGIGPDLMPYIAERNEDKFGKITPGTNIPIISETDSKSRNPYCYFVLPWHFKDAILIREFEFRSKTGVKFCFPLPKWEIV